MKKTLATQGAGFIFYFLLATCLLWAQAGKAQTKTWTGSTNNFWSNSNNWSPTGVPTNADDVVFPNSNGIACNIDANVNVKSITLQSGYTDFKTLCEQSDIISLHVPLNENTKFMIDKTSIAWMKQGVMLINTSRGGLVNTKAVVTALKKQHIGSFGMDVYEEEEGLFFVDHSESILQDDVIARLMTFKNVLITGHQAFLTDTALTNIADITIENINCFDRNVHCENEL